MTSALIIMAKRPRAGQTKTRLYPPLAGGDAAELYECFLRDVIATAGSVPAVDHFIAYEDPGDSPYFRALAPDFRPVAQGEGNLGERLNHVLSAVLGQGYSAAAAISSDSPQLPTGAIVDAFGLLATGEAEVVLGPCDDGGYYLIGVTQPLPRLVRDVRMSTPHALADTLRVAEEEGLPTALLPAAYDVDVWDDLLRLRGDLWDSPAAPHTRAWLAGADPRLFRRFCEG
jgi:uncharacterized protein